MLNPLLHLGVVGLAVPLPLFPLLISREPNMTGVDGGGIVRVSALSVRLRGVQQAFCALFVHYWH